MPESTQSYWRRITLSSNCSRSTRPHPGSPAELRYTLHDNRREDGQPGDHLMATAEFPADGRLIVASKVCHGPTPLRITGPSAVGG